MRPRQQIFKPPGSTMTSLDLTLRTWIGGVGGVVAALQQALIAVGQKRETDVQHLNVQRITSQATCCLLV